MHQRRVSSQSRGAKGASKLAPRATRARRGRARSDATLEQPGDPIGEAAVDVAVMGLVRADHQHHVAQRRVLWQGPQVGFPTYPKWRDQASARLALCDWIGVTREYTPLPADSMSSREVLRNSTLVVAVLFVRL